MGYATSLSKSKVTDKILEIRKFLTKIKYFARLRPPTIKALATKLVLKNFKGDHILCDQDDLCRNLYIIKNGQIGLKRVINKHKIDTSTFPKLLKEQLDKLPDEIETDVKLKYNSGDILLLNEIQNSLPSKYRIRVIIPSQLYVCTHFDLQRHVGLDKFSRVSDSDYFISNDIDILKHHVESILWKQYKSNVVDNHMLEVTKKQFYTKSAIRSNNQVSLGRAKEMDIRAKMYFQTKQQFFDIDKALKLPFLTKQPELGHARKLTQDSLPKWNIDKEFSKVSQASFRQTKIQEESISEDEIKNSPIKTRLPHHNHTNEYANDLDDEHLNAIFKYQYKRIVSMAFDTHKSNANQSKSKQAPQTSVQIKSTCNSPASIKTIKSMANLGKNKRSHSMSQIAVARFVFNK